MQVFWTSRLQRTSQVGIPDTEHMLERQILDHPSAVISKYIFIMPSKLMTVQKDGNVREVIIVANDIR
jgi:hypothetical protein